MAVILGNIYEISLRMSTPSGNAYNVFQYEAIFGDDLVDGAELGEAWWNHVKTVYRALVSQGEGGFFRSVTAKDLTNTAGLFGEYGIPAGERGGVRTGMAQGEPAPGFNAVGVRLAVGTRATRPGQKRLPGLVEEDLFGQAVHSVYLGLATTWAQLVTEDFVLGIPAALVTLRPVIVRRGAGGAIVATQPVTGYVVNPYITSQVSRKAGRGE